MPGQDEAAGLARGSSEGISMGIPEHPGDRWISPLLSCGNQSPKWQHQSAKDSSSRRHPLAPQPNSRDLRSHLSSDLSGERIDYLTFDLEPLDLHQTWRAVARHKTLLPDGPRLENVAWRRFFQSHYHLRKADQAAIWDRSSKDQPLYEPTSDTVTGNPQQQSAIADRSGPKPDRDECKGRRVNRPRPILKSSTGDDFMSQLRELYLIKTNQIHDADSDHRVQILSDHLSLSLKTAKDTSGVLNGALSDSEAIAGGLRGEPDDGDRPEVPGRRKHRVRWNPIVQKVTLLEANTVRAGNSVSPAECEDGDLPIPGTHLQQSMFVQEMFLKAPHVSHGAGSDGSKSPDCEEDPYQRDSGEPHARKIHARGSSLDDTQESPPGQQSDGTSGPAFGGSSRHWLPAFGGPAGRGGPCRDHSGSAIDSRDLLSFLDIEEGEPLEQMQRVRHRTKWKYVGSYHQQLVHESSAESLDEYAEGLDIGLANRMLPWLTFMFKLSSVLFIVAYFVVRMWTATARRILEWIRRWLRTLVSAVTGPWIAERAIASPMPSPTHKHAPEASQDDSTGPHEEPGRRTDGLRLRTATVSVEELDLADWSPEAAPEIHEGPDGVVDRIMGLYDGMRDVWKWGRSLARGACPI
ncbi:uncharacterized protein BJ171DRAFT_122501 [Polychytrium aggregatum]|uniref:uncharacterized protein n=1 Tax=Polychytrium aggregatum TaxID=110093 RepID=UPI0022FE2589|nr:uncharacterized protein BJ171DRAFT_122501 [Polychytrium aggregatum]KAI9204295.1 hypothetical protein BJ171DRAFT_122501 [Polychytrium aggregatum]